MIISLLLIGIAGIDRKEKRIPNKLLLALLAATILACIGGSEPAWWERLLGSLSVSLCLLLVIWIKPGAFGAGDVKLMAVSGILLGIGKNWLALVLAIVAAAIFCLAGIAARKVTVKSEIAFGPFLCLGIGLSMFAGDVILCRFFL